VGAHRVPDDPTLRCPPLFGDDEVVHGVVGLPDGAPVAQATVIVTSAQDQEMSRPGPWLTASDGYFVAKLLGPFHPGYSIRITRPGCTQPHEAKFVEPVPFAEERPEYQRYKDDRPFFHVTAPECTPR